MILKGRLWSVLKELIISHLSFSSCSLNRNKNKVQLKRKDEGFGETHRELQFVRPITEIHLLNNTRRGKKLIIVSAGLKRLN